MAAASMSLQPRASAKVLSHAAASMTCAVPVRFWVVAVISVAPKRRENALIGGLDAILGRTILKDGNMVPGDAAGLSQASMDLVTVCQQVHRLKIDCKYNKYVDIFSNIYSKNDQRLME